MHAFAEAFDAGFAHSFEVWNDKGELAGGGYGLAIGGSFVTESQFSREPNTSKIGFSSAQLASGALGLCLQRRQDA